MNNSLYKNLCIAAIGRYCKGVGVLALLLISTVAQAQPLSGTYTICATGCDYKGLTDAVSDLQSYGVSGAVVLDIAAGTYKEGGITMTNIAGVSKTNTITIQGAGRYSTTITDNQSYIIKLDKQDFVNIKSLHLDNQATSQANALWIDSSNYISVTNTRLQLPDGYQNWMNECYTLYIKGSKYCTIDNNYIRGGSKGIFNINFDFSTSGQWGLNYGDHGYHVFTKNTIVNCAETGMETLSGMFCTYSDNYIDTVSGAAIFSGYEQGAVYDANYLKGSWRGMSCDYPNGFSVYYGSSAPFIMKNNIIIGEDMSIGIYCDTWWQFTSVNFQLYHNTLVAGPKSSQWNHIVEANFYNANTWSVKNNIIYTSGQANGLYINNIDTAFDQINGNDYAIGSSKSLLTLGNSGIQYRNLSDLNSAWWTLEKNGSTIVPTFVSTDDYHLKANSPVGFGPYVGVDKDMDGDSRCTLFSAAGADESTYGQTAFNPNFSVPVSVYVNSPVVLYNSAKATDYKNWEWYVDGVFASSELNLSYTFPATGSVTVELRGTNCSGTYKISKSINVQSPTKAPTAYFVADKISGLPGEVIKFTSIVSDGPTKWEWKITPDSTFVGGFKVPRYKYLNGTDATSPHPIVRFDHGAKYTVCLTASNGLGAGNPECKTDYIEIVPSVNMGDNSKITATKGYIYDDGGPNNPYQEFTYRDLVVAPPCTEELYFVIKNFDMSCGFGYLQIYDGEDANGTPYHCTTNDNNGWIGPGFTGGNNGGTGCGEVCMPSLTDTFVSYSGKLFIQSQADWGAYPGFEIYYWTKSKTVDAPKASFSTVSDSFCLNQPIEFFNTSEGEEITYSWDFDGDFNTIEDDDDVSSLWVYTFEGKRTVTLIAENCTDIDTFQKTITIYRPKTPVVEFVADNLKPTTDDIVTFFPDIEQCVDDYLWTFTHANGTKVIYSPNSGEYSETPKVSFPETGCWDVELTAYNTNQSNPSGSLKKTCFIEVKDPYCKPYAYNKASDLGIANVIIRDLDSNILMANRSAQAQQDYTNYVPFISTSVEIGVSYELELQRNGSGNTISRTAWIDWNLDGDFNDAQEKIGEELNSSTTSWKTIFTTPIIAKTGASVLRVAVNSGTQSNNACGDNLFGEYEDYRLFISNDQTPPVIKLVGAKDTMVEQGRVYKDPGYSATDNLDGNVTSGVSADTTVLGESTPLNTLNTFVVRDYAINYRVTDNSGNQSIPTRRIVRIIPDTTAPEMKVELPETVMRNVDDTNPFQLPAITFTDDIVDGVLVQKNITILNGEDTVSAVNTTILDTYTVVYTASDAAGNTTVITRTVIVFDATDPVLTLTDDQIVNHQVNTTYADAGVDVSDNYYAESVMRGLISGSDNIDEDKIGTYTYTYEVTDPSGNGPVSVTRTVNVVDTIKPVLKIVGESIDTIDVFRKYTDLGANVEENHGLQGTVTAGGSFYAAFPDGIPNKLGAYVIEYTVTDLGGNTVIAERHLYVADRVAPEVTLVGKSSVNICRWEVYTDEGFTVNDNYYPESKITVIKEGTFLDEGETDIPGLYFIQYKATDSSGNVAYSEKRYINVLRESDYPCYTNGIEDEKDMQNFVNVYPNPASGIFNVRVDFPAMQQVSMSIVNLMGQEVARVQEGMLSSGVFTVDLSTQAAGVYMLRVNTESSSFTKQIIIAR